MNDNTPLYNSIVIKNFLEYLREYYPSVNIEELLEYAGITRYEVDDKGHWFTQRQTDRFHEIMDMKTGDLSISRKVGQRYVINKSFIITLQLICGFTNASSAFLVVSKIYNTMARNVDIQVKKINKTSVRIIVTPKPGINEKPYQCQNRTGAFEALAKVFTGQYGKVIETSCFHKGDDCCRYIVSWKNQTYQKIKQIRNFLILFFLPFMACLYFFAPLQSIIIYLNLYILLIIFSAFYSERLEKQELSKIIESQGAAAEDLLDELNIRHKNAELIQKISKAISMALSIDRLTESVADIMEQYLDLDYGMIQLFEINQQYLYYTAGFGLTDDQTKVLKQAPVLFDPLSHLYITLFKDRKPFLVNNINEKRSLMSHDIQNIIDTIHANSLICLPIIYEDNNIGVLIVGNNRTKRTIIQSDINLLTGIAGQIATGIMNTISFQKLKESENELRQSHDELEIRVEERTAELSSLNKELQTEIIERKLAEDALRASEEKYRLLSETAGEIILVYNVSGTISYINKAGLEISGYDQDEIIGMNIMKFIPEDKLPQAEEHLRRRIAGDEGLFLFDFEFINKNGDHIPIEVSTTVLNKIDGQINILFIARDVTERIRSEQQIRESLRQKEILLKEVHHRVKNNLQIISSILSMTGRRTDNPDAIDSLIAAKTKVHTMALIHTQLYQSERFDRIDMGMHVKELANQLAAMYGRRKYIKMIIHVPEIFLPVTQAIPCALVLNELISNAFKHAFMEGQEGVIEISGNTKDGLVMFSVKDNGNGIPEHIDIDYTESLGVKLVRNLVQKQLKGELTIDRNMGTEITIEFHLSGEDGAVQRHG